MTGKKILQRSPKRPPPDLVPPVLPPEESWTTATEMTLSNCHMAALYHRHCKRAWICWLLSLLSGIGPKQSQNCLGLNCLYIYKQKGSQDLMNVLSDPLWRFWKKWPCQAALVLEILVQAVQVICFRILGCSLANFRPLQGRKAGEGPIALLQRSNASGNVMTLNDPWNNQWLNYHISH